MKQVKLSAKNRTSQNSFFKNKNVLVCGGAGFVGSNILLSLLTSDANLRATYHIKKPQITSKKIKYLKADLTKGKDCRKVVRNIDYVFMCAANTSGAAVIENNPLVHVTPNVIMNALMLEAAYSAKVKKFLFISSNTVYPDLLHPVKEEEAFAGEPFYKYYPVAWMKRFGEIMCEMYAVKIKQPMQTVVVRPANIYGPYDDFDWETSHVVPSLIRKVVERQKPIKVWGDGRDIKDLIFVEDFVEGLVLAMQKLNKFYPINIATGIGISIRDVLKLCMEIDNYSHVKIEYDQNKPTMIKKRILDTSNAQKLLGFSASTSIEEGLKKTIMWYKENKIN